MFFTSLSSSISPPATERERERERGKLTSTRTLSHAHTHKYSMTSLGLSWPALKLAENGNISLRASFLTQFAATETSAICKRKRKRERERKGEGGRGMGEIEESKRELKLERVTN